MRMRPRRVWEKKGEESRCDLERGRERREEERFHEDKLGQEAKHAHFRTRDLKCVELGPCTLASETFSSNRSQALKSQRQGSTSDRNRSPFSLPPLLPVLFIPTRSRGPS